MSSNLEPHPSLPARPPAATYSAPPRHNNSTRQYPNAGAAQSFSGLMPRSVVSRAPAPHISAAPTHAPMMSTQAPFNAGGYQPFQTPSNAYYQQQQPSYGTSTPPAYTNPYPAPAATAGRGIGRAGAFDPEEEARIAEWNSAYTSKDDAANKKAGQGNANTIPLGTRGGEASAAPDHDTSTSSASAAKGGKEKTVVRQGGGKTWEDSSLLEWDPLHPRLFVGNLAGEVTDDSLMKAFSKYPSVSKARVVRDKKSSKSKSYGFVSFANTDDYFRAAKEMEGKYIGSHPVRIKRANTEVSATTKKDDKHGKHGKNNKKGGGIGGAGAGAGAFGNHGIQKHSHKNKAGGPRILG